MSQQDYIDQQADTIMLLKRNLESKRKGMDKYANLYFETKEVLRQVMYWQSSVSLPASVKEKAEAILKETS